MPVLDFCILRVVYNWDGVCGSIPAEKQYRTSLKMHMNLKFLRCSHSSKIVLMVKPMLEIGGLPAARCKYCWYSNQKRKTAVCY